MKENPKDDTRVKPRPPAWRTSAIAAAILAIIQACLTIEGRGIEGFILWVILLFVGYWLLFTFLIWLRGRRKERRE